MCWIECNDEFIGVISDSVVDQGVIGMVNFNGSVRIGKFGDVCVIVVYCLDCWCGWGGDIYSNGDWLGLCCGIFSIVSCVEG